MFEDVFNIVVVGEFSRGKSTVINALLGAQVLPKAPTEVTAVLTQISFGDNERYTVTFRNGSPKIEISSKEFAGLVAPPEPVYGDADSVRIYEERLAYLHSIEYVQIDYPCELCRDGVRLIDTPGTNGLNPAREEITYKIIPSADAVIFVMSAQTPATASELAFLRDQVMSADLGKIFLVMNFADSIETVKDRERIVSHAKREISSSIPSPEIFLVSAREALFHKLGKKGNRKLSLNDSGYPLLESELGSFLGSERGSVRLAKPIDRGLRVSAELERDIALQRRALEMPIAGLKAKVDQMKPRLEAVAAERDAALANLRIDLSNKGQDLAEEWRQGLEEIALLAERARASYQGAIDTNELIHHVESAVARLQTDLNEKLQTRGRGAVSEAMGAAQRRLQQKWNDFYVKFDQEFGSNEKPFLDPKGSALNQETPDDGFWRTMGGIGTVTVAVGIFGWFFLPFALPLLFLFRGKSEREKFDDRMKVEIKKSYSGGIPERVGKWRVGWCDQIAKVEKALRDECDRKLSDIQNQFDKSVREHASAEGTAKEKRAWLKELEEEINSVQVGLSAVKNERGFSK
jgi:GTPase SAR1 family protein